MSYQRTLSFFITYILFDAWHSKPKLVLFTKHCPTPFPPTADFSSWMFLSSLHQTTTTNKHWVWKKPILFHLIGSIGTNSKTCHQNKLLESNPSRKKATGDTIMSSLPPPPPPPLPPPPPPPSGGPPAVAGMPPLPPPAVVSWLQSEFDIVG